MSEQPDPRAPDQQPSAPEPTLNYARPDRSSSGATFGFATLGFFIFVLTAIGGFCLAISLPYTFSTPLHFLAFLSPPAIGLSGMIYWARRGQRAPLIGFLIGLALGVLSCGICAAIVWNM